MKFLILFLPLLLTSACTTLPKTFRAEKDRYVYQPTGSSIPKEVKLWKVEEQRISENLTP